jgi:hypothetical protein
VRTVSKVIAGGQTGVDQAALRAARECGRAIGGWCPPGRECESGVIPLEFPLQETERDRSPDAPSIPRSQRTEWNVRDSDATLVLRSATEDRQGDAGADWAVRCATRDNKPLFICELSDPDALEKIQQWLGAEAIDILNIAGPSEGTSPGIGERAYALLRRVFEDL